MNPLYPPLQATSLFSSPDRDEVLIALRITPLYRLMVKWLQEQSSLEALSLANTQSWVWTHFETRSPSDSDPNPLSFFEVCFENVPPNTAVAYHKTMKKVLLWAQGNPPFFKIFDNDCLPDHLENFEEPRAQYNRGCLYLRFEKPPRSDDSDSPKPGSSEGSESFQEPYLPKGGARKRYRIPAENRVQQRALKKIMKELSKD